MTRFTLHVPLFLSGGTPTPEAVLDTVEDALLIEVGGFTAVDGIGGWKGEDGRTYREPVRLYHADTDAPSATAAKLRTMADWLAIELAQEAVYLTRVEIGAQLVSPVAV